MKTSNKKHKMDIEREICECHVDQSNFVIEKFNVIMNLTSSTMFLNSYYCSLLCFLTSSTCICV